MINQENHEELAEVLLAVSPEATLQLEGLQASRGALQRGWTHYQCPWIHTGKKASKTSRPCCAAVQCFIPTTTGSMRAGGLVSYPSSTMTSDLHGTVGGVSSEGSTRE
jgi:hypothetical protein